MAVADDWLRWALKGMDGFCGHLANHARTRRLEPEERAAIISIVARLNATLADDERAHYPAAAPTP